MAKTITAGELALMPSEVRNLDYSPFLNANPEVDHLVSPTPAAVNTYINGDVNACRSRRRTSSPWIPPLS